MWPFRRVAVKNPSSEREQLLNDALCAYVKTFPQEQRLVEFVEQRHVAEELPQIKGALGALLGDTNDYLFARAGTIKWSEEFQRELFAHLKARHSWLTVKGFSPVVSYAGWLCWHEGLNAGQ